MPSNPWQAFVLFITFVTISMSACNRSSDKPLSIAMNDWTGYLPMVYARDKGLLDHKLVHLATLGSTTETLQQFRAGTVDAVTVTLDEALLLKSEGYDIAIVLVMDVSNGADAIVAKPGINSLAQLKGKRIGVENAAVGAYVLTRALEKAGLTILDITAVPMTTYEQASYFDSANIDAVVTFEPVKSQLIRMGGRVIFDSSMIPDEIIDVLAVKRECLDKEADKIKHAIDAWFQSIEYMQAHTDESVQWLASQLQLEPAAAAKAYHGILFPAREKNRILLAPGGYCHQTLNKMSRTMLENKLLPSNPDVSTLIAEQFVK